VVLLRDLENEVAPGYEPVAQAFGKLVSGSAGGGALSIRRHGQSLVSICKGSADSAGRAWTNQTPALSFSTSKGVASAVIHRLVDRGELDLDEPVATFWPEFAAGGKAEITVRDVLSALACETHQFDITGAPRASPRSWSLRNFPRGGGLVPSTTIWLWKSDD